MVHKISDRELKRFDQHGVLFIPVRRMELGTLVDMSSIASDNLKIWGKGGFDSKLIISSNNFDLPKDSHPVRLPGGILVQRKGYLHLPNSDFISIGKSSEVMHYVGDIVAGRIIPLYVNFR